MNKKLNILPAALLVLFLSAIVALASCAAPVDTAEENASKNREFMSQVSKTTESLTDDLQGFSDAVAQDNYVAMRSQAESASRSIDELEKIEAPDAMKDIKSEYVAGGKDLREALDGYIDLLSEIEASTEEQPYDFSSYEDKLTEIQKKYDSGIDHLKEADKKANEMP